RRSLLEDDVAVVVLEVLPRPGVALPRLWHDVDEAERALVGLAVEPQWPLTLTNEMSARISTLVEVAERGLWSFEVRIFVEDVTPLVEGCRIISEHCLRRRPAHEDRHLFHRVVERDVSAAWEHVHLRALHRRQSECYVWSELVRVQRGRLRRLESARCAP